MGQKDVAENSYLLGLAEGARASCELLLLVRSLQWCPIYILFPGDHLVI